MTQEKNAHKAEFNNWRGEEEAIQAVKDRLQEEAMEMRRPMPHYTRAEWLELSKELKRSRYATRYAKDSMRRAKVADYDKWLAGFLEAGGTPTHYYDYPLPHFWVATRDFTVEPKWGARAREIIVPVGITVTIDILGKGHNDFFYMDGYTASGSVPVYTDTLRSWQTI